MVDTDPSVTPEKRLLKLIEDPQSEKSDPPQKGGGLQWLRLFSPSGLKSLFTDFRENWSGFVRKHKGKIQLRQVNQLAKAVTAGLVIFLIGSVIYEVKMLNNDYMALFDISTKKISDLPVQQNRGFGSTLFESAQTRNIFVPYGKRNEEAANEKSASAMRLLDVTKNLKLTGISINPVTPEQTFCMIEDIEKNITTFLRVGDSILGLKVVNIREDSVTLQYQGESIEIR